MNNKPKFMKLLQNDYSIFASFVGIIISAGMGVFAILGMYDTMLAIVMFAITIASFVLFIYRLLYLRRLFETGIIGTGTILEIWFHRDRGRINFTYEHEGKTYSSGNAIMKNKRTKSLSIGIPITIIINKDNHKKALIKDLYI